MPIPLAYQRANVAGTQAMLEFARARGIRQFVFASSSSVYGVNPRVPWSEDDHVLQPISPYASTKVSGELLGHVYSQLYGIRFLALRFFTVYGPRQRPDLAIHAFARRLAARRRHSRCSATAARSRDYTFVDDIDRRRPGGDGLHRLDATKSSTWATTGRSALREMIASARARAGRDGAHRAHPEQPGDVPQTWARIDKARALVGLQPRHAFRERRGRVL